jgi:hypothetical protein
MVVKLRSINTFIETIYSMVFPKHFKSGSALRVDCIFSGKGEKQLNYRCAMQSYISSYDNLILQLFSIPAKVSF